MQNVGTSTVGSLLAHLGQHGSTLHQNLPPDVLINHALAHEHLRLTSTGAVAVDTGKFTGRAPKDRFIVKDKNTAAAVNWNSINQPISIEAFDRLYERLVNYLCGRNSFVRKAAVCADPRFRIGLRVITENAWANLFAYNMFLRPDPDASTPADEWAIIFAPGFKANPAVDGTRQENFSILDLSRKTIIIGGTGYPGEIKKAVFSALNFVLPQAHDVLPMHCAANVDKHGRVALFFGLSGTGKTTLSADPERSLIGDDEHGWTPDDVIFNFEGGCYAKVINLTERKEPAIFQAIRAGALLENIGFKDGSNEVDYTDDSKTENTRVSYPIDHIRNIASPSLGNKPRHIFFLTCDAFGVLPPLSRLTPGQAAFHFLSGYTAKVAGTEDGIEEPTTTFSACFGAPFMPLQPTVYASMLIDRLRHSGATVWLVNTSWYGGPYGVGQRMPLQFTRRLIHAAISGELEMEQFNAHEVFGVYVPTYCPGVPPALLDPRNTWHDGQAYDAKAHALATAFLDNFAQFAPHASEETRAGAPTLHVAI